VTAFQGQFASLSSRRAAPRRTAPRRAAPKIKPSRPHSALLINRRINYSTDGRRTTDEGRVPLAIPAGGGRRAADGR